jgi:flagellar hook-associated protein 1 FlgK
MSLIGSLQIASNALFAQQVGLQVAANNIANANTEGYIRQRTVLTPGPTQKIGKLPLGLGVKVDSIIQVVDKFVQERLLSANSDLLSFQTQERAHLELEVIVGELSDTDLSSSLNNFFGSINDVVNQPGDISLRRLAVLEGVTLTDDIRRLDNRVRDLRTNINREVIATADDINRLSNEIAALNIKIVVVEEGGANASDAVGLRDQRGVALAELDNIVGIESQEQDSGSVTVSVGGEFLVSDGTRREVGPSNAIIDGTNIATINILATDAALRTSTGKLAGLYIARDEIFGSFLTDLQVLTGALIFDFNKVFASGQGLTGFKSVTGTTAVTDTTAALDAAGLAFTPENGSFQIKVENIVTNVTETVDIFVDLNGLTTDTSLTDITATINAISGISAQVTLDNRLEITSDSNLTEFSFAKDTSGVLAALGINTFFTISTTNDIGINQAVQDDATKFVGSRSGVGVDADQAIELAGFLNTPLESYGQRSLSTIYEDFVGEVVQSAAVARSVTEGFLTFARTLEGQHLGISGVSIDQETIDMLAYQRAFQASARLVATIDELLGILVNL